MSFIKTVIIHRIFQRALRITQYSFLLSTVRKTLSMHYATAQQTTPYFKLLHRIRSHSKNLDSLMSFKRLLCKNNTFSISQL